VGYHTQKAKLRAEVGIKIRPKAEFEKAGHVHYLGQQDCRINSIKASRDQVQKDNAEYVGRSD